MCIMIKPVSISLLSGSLTVYQSLNLYNGNQAKVVLKFSSCHVCVM